MLSGALTLLDLVKLRGASLTVQTLIEEIRLVAPELTSIGGRTITGTTLKQPIRRQLPSGGFRNVNEGIALTKSEYDDKETTLSFFDAQMQADEALITADNPQPRVLANESTGAMRGAAIQVGLQFYYGTSNLAKGFPGLQGQVLSTMTVNAGGSSAGACSSVYAIWEGDDGVELLFGNGGDFGGSTNLESDWMRQRISDGNSNPYFAWVNNFKGWIGLWCGYSRCAGVIKNIDGTNGHTMTDALGFQLLSKFPTGAKPTRFLMNNQRLFELQLSRSSINQVAYKLGAVADLPTEIGGVPITVTDSILNTEAVR